MGIVFYIYDLYKSSGQDQINTRSSVLKLKHPSRSACPGQNTSYLTPTIWNNLPTCLKLSNSSTVSNMVWKNIFSRNWRTKSKIFLLISNCCMLFGNVSTSEGAHTIFDFPVILDLGQLLVGIWVSFTFNFSCMFKNCDFLRGFF